MKKKVKVLIVEDSPTQALSLQGILEQAGLDVALASNGQDGLLRARESGPDVVISDILMPGMDGYEFCRRLKTDPDLKNILVILLTSLDDPQEVMRGLECGADNFMAKPYDKEFLLSRIDRILKTRTRQAEKPAADILIVEDSPTQAARLRAVLEAAGYTVRLASNGKEAIACVKKKRPTLIVSDIVMPEMDGYEFCRAIKENDQTKRIPVVLLTQLSDPDEVRRAVEAHADDYITKPCAEDFLLSCVERLLPRQAPESGPCPPESARPVLDRELIGAISQDRMLNFLLSTYENAVYQKHDLQRMRALLENANQELEKRLRELRESEERFRTVVLTIPDIIYRIDETGRFIFVNQSVRNFGYEPDELIGRNFSEILLPVEADSVAREKVLPRYAGKITGAENAPKLFDERRTAERRTTGLEVRVLLKDGTRQARAVVESAGSDFIIAEINSSGLFEVNPHTKNRVFLGTVGVIRDITERKKFEEELDLHRVNLENLVSVRTEELRRVNSELERFNRLAVGRELRMIELKREINEMAAQAGKSPPYDLAFLEKDAVGGSSK